MKKLLAIAAACLLSLPSFAAGALDALRANSRALRAEVSAIRSQQLNQRNELSAVSSRVETLKGESKGKLLPGGELDQALKRSQELSGSLSGLGSQLSVRESELEAANLALIESLSKELSRLRAEFDRQSNRQVRSSLIGQMRRLRAERDALRATLPAAKLPALDTRPSEDPEELLEQADLLRDSEEKLKKQLKQLQARITERREELELDERMQRFMGEESMFDDSDRRLRVQRTTITVSGGVQATSPENVQTPQVGDNAAPMHDSFQAGTGTTAETTRGNDFAAAPGETTNATDHMNEGVGAPGFRTTNGSDARPQVGSSVRLDLDTGDLSALERQAAELEKLRDELGKKVNDLESRAAKLK